MTANQNANVDKTALMAKWGEFLNESHAGLTANKKVFVAQILNNKQMINESGPVMNISSNAANSNGIGSIVLPSNTSNFRTQSAGSGDVPIALTSMAMSVAAHTIGFDLLPTVPIYNQAVMLQYIDFVYAGGRLDAADDVNKPEFVEALVPELKGNAGLVVGADVLFYDAVDKSDAVTMTFIGFSRVEANALFKIKSLGSQTGTALNSLLATKVDIATVVTTLAGNAVFSLPRAVENRIGAFAAYGQANGEGVSRGDAEKGTRSVLEMKTYSKLVQTKEQAVEAVITRQQARTVKDMGIDGMPALKIAMQNEIIQNINAELLTTMRKYGVTTHLMLQKSQGLNLHTFVGPAGTTSKALNTFGSKGLLVDATGTNVAAQFSDAVNSETNSAAENLYSRQRRIRSRILAGCQLIGQVSRWGAGNAAVVNSQLLAALKEAENWNGARATDGSTISSDAKTLYYAGETGGVAIYCDPELKYTDTVVTCVRTGKSDTGNDALELHEGLVFLPYDLASSVDIIAEGTMAPKSLVESIYAIAPIGIRPELAYLTFACETGFGSWV